MTFEYVNDEAVGTVATAVVVALITPESKLAAVPVMAIAVMSAVSAAPVTEYLTVEVGRVGVLASTVKLLPLKAAFVLLVTVALILIGAAVLAKALLNAKVKEVSAADAMA
jgi:hypothetical protein